MTMRSIFKKSLDFVRITTCFYRHFALYTSFLCPSAPDSPLSETSFPYGIPTQSKKTILDCRIADNFLQNRYICPQKTFVRTIFCKISNFVRIIILIRGKISLLQLVLLFCFVGVHGVVLVEGKCGEDLVDVPAVFGGLVHSEDEFRYAAHL